LTQQQELKEKSGAANHEGKKIETGGKLFLEILQEKKVDFVFGTTGAGMADIQDAMVVVKPPKWIQGLHEFATVNAAAGYALATENFGIALIDRNVGTANAVGAFYCTYMNSAPIVVFASVNLPGVPIETGEVEYHYITDEAGLLGPWIKWNAKLESIDTLEDDVSKAIFAAKSEQPGPVYYTLRQDLMAKKLDESMQEKHLSLPEKEKRKENPPPSYRLPDDQTIDKIVDEILSHNSPQVVVSHLGRHRSSVNSLVNFAHTFGVSVIDLRTFMNYPTNDPLHAGFTKPTKPPKVGPAIDLVVTLEVGMLPNNKFPEKTDVIDLTSDPLHRQDVQGGGDYGSTLISAGIRSVCDVGPTLEKITKSASSKLESKEKERISNRIQRAASEHDEFFEKAMNQAQKSYDSGKLDSHSVGKILNDHWSSSFIWVDGTWTPRMDLLSLVQTTKPGTYFSNPSGHLGPVVGMAYGVALANRRYVEADGTNNHLKIGKISHAESPRPVICTTGDGDATFGNIPSALWTCSHYGIGVAYIIMNNACWGIEWPPIEKSTMHWAKDNNDFEFLDLDKPRISYNDIARGFEVQSESVQTPEEFESALELAIQNAQNDKPMLIDVRMEKYTGPKQSSVP
jgi:acetolactate synthase I/II/III large subunit